MRIPTPKALAFVLFAASLVAPPPELHAQEGDLAEIILVKARVGHDQAFEEGVKAYFEEVRRQQSPFAWLLWEIMTGENTGSYYVGSFDHSWSDFDRMPSDPAAMRASFREHVEPHVESANAGFWMHRDDLSHEPAMEEEGPPPAFEQIFFIKPTMAGAQEWEGLVRELVGAARDADWETHWGTFQLVNGGELPQYVLAIGGDRFADFEEPSPTMAEMLTEQLGAERMQEIFQRFGELTEWEKSEMIAWREDLSYLP